jgi:hypothetical protein
MSAPLGLKKGDTDPDCWNLIAGYASPASLAAIFHNTTGTITGHGPLSFLNTWTFKLGTAALNHFGRQQMFDLGVSMRMKYGQLLEGFTDVSGITLIQTFRLLRTQLTVATLNLGSCTLDSPGIPYGISGPHVGELYQFRIWVLWVAIGGEVSTGSNDRSSRCKCFPLYLLSSTLAYPLYLSQPLCLIHPHSVAGPPYTHTADMLLQYNNTLSPYYTCPNTSVASRADRGTGFMKQWISVYLADAKARIQGYLSGYTLTLEDLFAMQTMCAYEVCVHFNPKYGALVTRWNCWGVVG